jgi:uncharacterized protein YcbX
LEIEAMSIQAQPVLGSIVALWRYPVKAMLGEELNAAKVTEDGLFGDRAYALIDDADGKVATAKNPRKWPHLFDFRAELADGSGIGASFPRVRITLPDGSIVSSEQPNVHQVISNALTRAVTLASIDQRQRNAQTATAEEYWPDFDGLEHRDVVTEFGLPDRTFFDCATVHILTTATLDRLRVLYPQGRFESRRFRPNIVVDILGSEPDFIENEWIGHVLSVGDEVRLSITGSCSRCVMTTLPQGDLPRDAGILRTVAKHNAANVGVYASVLQGGKVRRGDSVSLSKA